MTNYGVVLGGGGAKGSYEVGVWKALMELNISITSIAGTSAGALNGAMMVQGDYETAYKLWCNIDIQQIINLSSFLTSDGKLTTPIEFANAVKTIIDNKGLDVSPLKDLLTKYINEETIRKSPINFGLVSFCLTSLKPLVAFKEDIPHGMLIDYLLASSCLPIFKPLEIKNNKYIDGGIYDNIPISALAQKNIKNIIAVDVSGIGRIRKIDENDLNIIHIKNSQFLCKTLEFDGKCAVRNINIGYLDTLKVFNKLHGKNYYAKNSINENKLLYPLNEKEILKLIGTLELNRAVLAKDRFINHNIIKCLRNNAESKLNSVNSVLSATEITAEVFGIDRLKIYNWDELGHIIIKKYSKIKDSCLFKKSLQNIKNIIHTKNKTDFDILNGSFIVCYLTEMEESDSNINNIQKFLAIFFPKLYISNIFLSILLERTKNIF